VSFGKADAAIGELAVINHLLNEHMMSNLIISGEAIMGDPEFSLLSIAARKNLPDLASILTKGLESISIKEKRILQEKWFGKSNIKRINLTKEENSFIKSNQVIRIHNETNWPPYNYNEAGKPLGFSVDIMELIAQKTGLKVEFITGPSWNGFLEMMKNDSLEVMLNIVKTPERLKYLIYTPPYADNPNSILSKKEKPYENIESLFGKTVAIPKGFFTEEILRKSYPEIKLLLVKNLLEAMKAVSFGKADAAIGELAVINHFLNEHMMSNLIISGEAIMGDPEFSLLNIATRQNLPILASILTKGVESISLEEKRKLQEKWFGKSGTEVINLTSEEKNYLATKKEIKMSVLPNTMPFEQIDKDGEHSGVAEDIIKLISEKINKPIVLVPTKNWSESLENIKNRKADILPVAINTLDHQKYVNFTKPYIKEALVIATKEDKFFIKNISELSNRKIGVINTYRFTKTIKKRNPDIKIIDVKNIKDGLERVQSGELFGYVDALHLIAFTIQKEGMFDLKIAGKFDFEMKISIASRNDEPLLNSIMQKALEDIGEEQIQSIIGKWISIKVEQSFDYRKLIYISLFFLTILIILTFKNRSIRKLNNEIVSRNSDLYNQKKDLEESYQNLKKAQEEILDLERKNSILAMIVTTNHEINQPLTSALGNLYILEMKLDKAQIDDMTYKKHIVKTRESLNLINLILTKYRETNHYDISDYVDGVKMVKFKE